MKQKMRQFFKIAPALLLVANFGCAPKAKKEDPNLVMYNQVGYQTNAPKLALVPEGTTEVVILDAAGQEVFRTVPPAASFWDQSGDAVSVIDFSSINTPGQYTLVLAGKDETVAINIADHPFTEVAKAALKSFYYNRTAMPIDVQFGGVWARGAGHPDTAVLVHASAASEARPEGTVLSSPLGWYDAGDYNKYIVNSGISTSTLLRALADYTDYFKLQNLNIPESGGPIPDILAESLFNLRWVLTMQDPNDGGVYHKLTNKSFDAFIMPDQAVEARYVVQKGTGATLNYAALAAQANRTLKPWAEQLPGLADSCLQKAELAWQWAIKNPALEYKQPSDISTGGYGDSNFEDEWFWAASELYLATGKQEYLNVLLANYKKPVVPTWGQTDALGLMSLLDNYDLLPEVVTNTNLKEDFITLVDELTTRSKTAPYAVSINQFAWGSNSDVANHGMLKLFAYKITNNEDYVVSALSDLDYILGRNATGYCFVTGFGTKKVMNIHHRPSSADGIVDPVPGFLAGGPNLSVLTDCDSTVVRSPFAAKSFVDLECSYSTNEMAINWNAPLVYLTSGIDALLTPEKRRNNPGNKDSEYGGHTLATLNGS
jgi:endoglucanase